MIKCAGPACPGPVRTSSVPVDPEVEYGHPAPTVEPGVVVPPELTVISCPELLDSVEPASEPPFPTVNDRSLSNWETSVGLAWRFVSVMFKVPALTVNITSALTGPPGAMAPGGVTNGGIDPACAGAATPQRIRPATTIPRLNRLVPTDRFFIVVFAFAGGFSHG
jgi:hypothetical protein